MLAIAVWQPTTGGNNVPPNHTSIAAFALSMAAAQAQTGVTSGPASGNDVKATGYVPMTEPAKDKSGQLNRQSDSEQATGVSEPAGSENGPKQDKK